MLWSQREMLVRLYREECPCSEQDTRIFLRDCYDHTVQIMDLMESYREMAASMLEVYLSSVSNRLNESMRLLTIKEACGAISLNSAMEEGTPATGEYAFLTRARLCNRDRSRAKVISLMMN